MQLSDLANKTPKPVKNVRSPSLIPGCFYVMKTWGKTDKFELVRFDACKRNGVAVNNIPLKEMTGEDAYVFNTKRGVLNARMHENCLCIGEARITLFSFEGAIYPETAPAKVAKPRKELSVAVVEEEEDLGVWGPDEEEDGEPIGVLCHPYSMMPLDKNAPRTRI